jgi:hypothetical protein
LEIQFSKGKGWHPINQFSYTPTFHSLSRVVIPATLRSRNRKPTKMDIKDIRNFFLKPNRGNYTKTYSNKVNRKQNKVAMGKLPTEKKTRLPWVNYQSFLCLVLKKNS